jgi:uncharacterized protein YgiM (DUF1202 family)
MCRRRSYRKTGLLIVSSFLPCIVATKAVAQTAEKPVISQGEVTGSDVYVRSGPSLNHYTIVKLGAGDRVDIVGETGDWFEIRSPAGVFSLISGDYVDTADGKTGVVNGHNVRVRAGSLLNENKYTVQLMLSKGAEVEILGRNPDGFLRIKPPRSATVWITRRFVEYVPDERLRVDREKVVPPATEGRESTADEVQPGATAADAPAAGDNAAADEREVATTAPAAAVTPLTDPQSTEERRRLEQIDADVRAELEKPAPERRFEPFIERYQEIAKQLEDDFARRYALVRIDQLQNMSALVQTLRRVRSLANDTEAKRREFLEGRARIQTAVPPVVSGMDAQGELRVSALYPPGSWPQRYRLVDTSGPTDRTIGYVEVPRDSSIEVADFIGRYVGVRALSKRLQTGGVNPVPIFVARELVLLRPAPRAAGSSDQS